MEKIDIEKIKAVLPSKQFARLIIGVFVVVLIFIGTTSYFGSRNEYNQSGKNSLTEKGMTVGDIVTLDSNNNGIPDWEESLWGLDPKADGATNKMLLAQKKAASGIPTTDSTPDSQLTETDKFSRSLLATLIALQQSGNLTPIAITNLAASVGDNVNTKHVSVRTYTLEDLRMTTADDAAAKAAYMAGLKQILDQYSSLNLGSELETIASGFDSQSPQILQSLAPTAAAYTAISTEMLALPTPRSAAPYALDLINSSAIMGATLPQVENFYSDVIAGMVGLDDYIKASNVSDAASANMRTYFAQQ